MSRSEGIQVARECPLVTVVFRSFWHARGTDVCAGRSNRKLPSSPVSCGDARLFRPLAAADQPQAPPALRQALAVIDHHVEDYIAQARLKIAA